MNYHSVKIIKKSVLNSLFLFVFVVSSNTVIVAQTKNNLVDMSTIEESTRSEQVKVSTVSVSNASSMQFILWFMGSKQDLNSTISADGTNAKKQVITSGTAPNRLLIKAFLKKAVDLENRIA